MDFINYVFDSLISGLNMAFASLPPGLALTIHAFLISLITLFVYAHFSNQSAIKRAKDRLTAYLLEIRLYQDDPILVVRAFGRIIGGTFIYLKGSMKPLFVMLPLIFLWIVHLASWFEWRPLLPGESTLVTARLGPDSNIMSQAESLIVPAGIELETPAFRSLSAGELVWRVKALFPTRGDIKLCLAGQEIKKNIITGDRFDKATPKKLNASSSIWDRLMHPVEPLIEEACIIQEIRVNYPQRELMIMGIHVHWLIWLLLASVLFGLALKRPLRVEF